MEGTSRAHAKKTPRTVTRLMQLHRDNERSRHQGINTSISHLSRRIPGHSIASRETKIVKLQRIINYICHLERHIETLFREQNIDMESSEAASSPEHLILSEEEYMAVGYYHC